MRIREQKQKKLTAEQVRREALDGGLPKLAVTPHFAKQLIEAANATERDRLIREMRKFLGLNRNGLPATAYELFAEGVRDDIDEAESDLDVSEPDAGYERFVAFVEGNRPPRDYDDFITGLERGREILVIPDDDDEEDADLDADEDEGDASGIGRRLSEAEFERANAAAFGD